MLEPMLEPTADPTVFIEERRQGYVRYRRITDGRRWEVWGTCDRRGDCLIGAVVLNEHREHEVITDHAHLKRLSQRTGRERVDSEMDVPVTPEFDTCCGADIFTYRELAPLGD